MLVEFSVDPWAIRENPNDRAAAIGNLETLVDIWERYGLIVFGKSREDGSHLLDEIENLPDQLRRLWQRALEHNRCYEADFDWDGPAAMEGGCDVDDICAPIPELDLVLLDDVRAADLGFGDAEITRMSAKKTVELGLYRFANIQPTIRDARTIQETHISKGRQTNEIWRERFERLARHSDTTAIVDRYAFSQLMKAKDGLSGLERFCRKLVQTARPDGVLKVFSEFREVDGHHEWAVVEYRERLRKLVKQINNGRLRSAQFYIVENIPFRDHGHDRHIRFDHTVCSIGKGLEVLADDEVFADSNFFTLLCNRSVEDIEYKLSSRRNRIGEPEGW